MWRWGSLVACIQALKRRKGPLQAMWNEKKSCEGSSTWDDDGRSRAKAAKIAQVESSWSKGDAKKLTAVVNNVFFWAYLAPNPAL